MQSSPSAQTDRRGTEVLTNLGGMGEERSCQKKYVQKAKTK